MPKSVQIVNIVGGKLQFETRQKVDQSCSMQLVERSPGQLSFSDFIHAGPIGGAPLVYQLGPIDIKLAALTESGEGIDQTGPPIDNCSESIEQECLNFIHAKQRERRRIGDSKKQIADKERAPFYSRAAWQ